MEDSFLDDVRDLLVGDGCFLRELVVGAAVLDCVKKGLLVGHGSGCG